MLFVQLGDVHAHFGIWPAAEDAWGGALDALLGPYQVVRNWTTKLTLGSWQELLARYGAHGLLLAGTLLGKLARLVLVLVNSQYGIQPVLGIGRELTAVPHA